MKRIRVGVIGLGQIAQVVHLPNLEMMDEKFDLAAFCDISPGLLEFMGRRYGVSGLYTDYRELVRQQDLDAVLVLNGAEYHAECAVAALDNGKHVMIEKPMCYTMREADAIIEAQRRSAKQAMMAYMRRYAEAFLMAKEEIAALPEIHHVRVRDIIGQNRYFTDLTSKTVRFDDVPQQLARERAQKADALLREAVGDVSDDLAKLYRFCGGLCSHDISAMRELVGMPTRIIGAAKKLGAQFLQVLFDFGEFQGMYEVGVDRNRRFDAHIAVYGPEKSVTVQYDTPYIRHLPTTLVVQETVDDRYRERVERPTYRDPFTAELLHFYDCITGGKTPKTTPEDAKRDLEISRMVMEAVARGREGPSS